MNPSFRDADLIREELRAKYERKGSLTQSRILPKSTADVHAAIAAISLRREAEYHDRSDITKALGSIAYIMKTNKNEVDYGNHERCNSDYQTRDDINIVASDSDISSDYSSDDSSVENDEMVPTATRVNIAAYIDSLKNGQKRSSHESIKQSTTDETTKILPEIEDESHLENHVSMINVNDPVGGKSSDDKKSTINDMIQVESTTQKDQKCSFDDSGLEEHVRKASLLAEDVDCSVDDINRIILFAREKGYPTRLLLDAFCETRVEIGYDPRRDDVAIYCELIRKAIDVVEQGHHNFRNTVKSLLSSVKQNNFDDSLIRNIIDHPELHTRDPGNDSTRLSSEYYDEFGLQEDSFDAHSTSSEKISYLDRKINHLSNADRCSKLGNTGKVPQMSAVLLARKIRKHKALKSLPCLVDFKPRSFRLTIHERLQLHPGFKNVDSITETVLSQPFFDKENLVPIAYDDYFDWEDVPISQFTNRKSVTETNWFGTLEKTLKNNRFKGPITPAFGIPFQGFAHPQEWDQDWYTSWSAKKNQNLVHIKQENELSRYKPFKSGSLLDRPRLPTKPSVKTSFQSDSSVLIRDDISISSQLKSANLNNAGDDDGGVLWIGNIYVVKNRPGERMSRVHPDFTSFLHKSRWKRKYFPSRNETYASTIFMR